LPPAGAMKLSNMMSPSPEQLEELEDLKRHGYAKSELPSVNENFPLDCLDCGAMIRYPNIHDKVCPGKNGN
jgi:hypothetical protein